MKDHKLLSLDKLRSFSDSNCNINFLFQLLIQSSDASCIATTEAATKASNLLDNFLTRVSQQQPVTALDTTKTENKSLST